MAVARAADPGPPSGPAVEVRSLRRVFGSCAVLDDMDLTVQPGSVTGFLDLDRRDAAAVAPALDQWGAGAADLLDEIVSTAALVPANRTDAQIAFGAPALSNELNPISATDPVPEPDELAGTAVEHGDEHVIELTEAAVRQLARTPDRVLLVAADRYRRRTEGQR